jgi:triosephosphate isomerase (TIM)
VRTPIVAGNWKMFNTVSEARVLVSELIPSLSQIQGVDKVICPPFTALLAVRALLEGTQIRLGAQNLYWETSGAFTGEVSPKMIAEFCTHVIIGHSERRAYFNETDSTVNLKTKAALQNGLTPIVCVGETLVENEAGETANVVTRQILDGLSDIILSTPQNIVIAYEPVWAIGTGKAATSQGANQVIGGYIRPALAKLFGSQSADEIRILYGGSVKGSNAAEFFNQSDIDGALVGGASLKANDFSLIAQAAA